MNYDSQEIKLNVYVGPDGKHYLRKEGEDLGSTFYTLHSSPTLIASEFEEGTQIVVTNKIEIFSGSSEASSNETKGEG